MPEASSLNIGSSPLNALFGAGVAAIAAGGATGGAAQAEDGNPGGFQAMLAAQTGEIPAPGIDLGAGAGLLPTPGPALTVLAAGQTLPAATDPSGKTAPAPVVATMAALRNNGAAMNGADMAVPQPLTANANPPIAPSNGNLPEGGKILPVALAPADNAPEASDAPADPASDPASDASTKAPAVVTPRPRLFVAPPVRQDKTTTQGDEATAAPSEEAAAAPAEQDAPSPSPQGATPDPLALANGAGAVILSMNPPAPTAGNAAPTADKAAKPSGVSDISAVAPAGRIGGTAAATPVRDPALDPAAADGAGAALPTGAVWPAGLLQPQGAPKVSTGQDAPIQPTATPAALALTKPAAKPAKPAGADLSSSAGDGASPQAPLALHQGAQSVTPDSPSPGADAITEPLNTVTASLPSSADTSRMAAPANLDTGASRDMSALVDRLVETRAAMRSGAPAQWVQTAIQHAEFGRVALQIRQDGDNLSVAMTSNDPGFAPAAQAALNGSQSLLQPASASQNSADTGQNADQNAGQNSGQQPFGGQFNGQFSGQQQQQQQQQPATRQQAPFINTPAAAPKDQAAGDPAGSATSHRSGILA